MFRLFSLFNRGDEQIIPVLQTAEPEENENLELKTLLQKMYDHQERIKNTFAEYENTLWNFDFKIKLWKLIRDVSERFGIFTIGPLGYSMYQKLMYCLPILHNNVLYYNPNRNKFFNEKEDMDYCGK